MTIEKLIEFLRREISAQTPIYSRNEKVLFMDPKAELNLKELAEALIYRAEW